MQRNACRQSQIVALNKGQTLTKSTSNEAKRLNKSLIRICVQIVLNHFGAIVPVALQARSNNNRDSNKGHIYWSDCFIRYTLRPRAQLCSVPLQWFAHCRVLRSGSFSSNLAFFFSSLPFLLAPFYLLHFSPVGARLIALLLGKQAK